jgi:hypothetical protein
LLLLLLLLMLILLASADMLDDTDEVSMLQLLTV